jgi:hypothetical protein
VPRGGDRPRRRADDPRLRADRSAAGDPRRRAGLESWRALLADGVRIGVDFDGIEARRMLVHVDLDVIDWRYGRANPFACEGGLSPDELLRVIESARERFPIAGLVIASYDPSCDADGRIADAVLRIIRMF